MADDGGNQKIQPRLAPIMHAYLDDLVRVGPYGDSPTEVAKSLIELGVMEAIAKAHIKVRRRPPGGR
jgi:hypothetical protein